MSRKQRTKASYRLLLLAGASTAAATTLFLAACSSDERTSFDAPADATSDAVAHLPDAASPPADSSVDVGRPNIDASDEPVVCEGNPCAVQLAAGAAHFCARMSDGTVRCWGDDTAGALGRGEAEGADPGSPEIVTKLADVVQISAARATTCALDGAGVVRCWGNNAEGLLGLAASPAVVDTERHPTPAPVAASAAFARVDVAAWTACALTTSGGAVCWGANDQKQLARSDVRSNYAGPASADLLSDAISRTGGTPYTSFGLTIDGSLLTWGVVSGDLSVSGRESSISPDSIPAPIPSLRGVTSFAAGEQHACAIVDGAVLCWGGPSSLGGAPFSVLCTGLTSREILPVSAKIESPPYPQQLAAGKNSTCARLTDGTLRCCGDDEKGQLGTGEAGAPIPRFTSASAFKGYAVQVAVSADATCALLRGGTVECWGGNDRGQLGRGGHDVEPHPAPAPVAF